MPSSFKMAAARLSTREVFAEGVRAVLETWPVLQIAVDNGFGGAYSQQKADWMVDVVQQYFHDNADLQPCEVEDFLAELMNNEFDTVVDDGSLSQVALQLSGFFEQCERGQLAEVRARITQLSQRKGTARVTAVPAKSPGQEEEEDSSSEEEEEAEAMECEVGAAAGVSTQTHTPPEDNAPAPETEDGWTVVRKKK